jgi:hypothetical protein
LISPVLAFGVALNFLLPHQVAGCSRFERIHRGSSNDAPTLGKRQISSPVWTASG